MAPLNSNFMHQSSKVSSANMSEIKIHESLGTFVYFFFGTCALAIVGAWIPGLAKDIGDVMQEHIAGKTILASAGVALFIGYICAARNIFKPQPYGKFIRFFVVNPSNFVITLAFVATAINWGVAISTRTLFSIIVNGEIFSALIRNALQITGIALLLSVALWPLHLAPADSKTVNPFETLAKTFFWFVFAASTIFWLAFFGTITKLALNA